MGNSGLAILLVGGLAVLLIFSGTIMELVGGLPGQIQTWIEQIQGNLPGSGGGTVTGYTWIGYTVTFTDGTSQDIRQTRPAFSLFPFSITFDGKEISTVKVDIKAEFTEGAISSWDSNSSLRVELYKKPETVPKTSSTGHYLQNGQTWALNTIKTIGGFTVPASDFENVFANFGDGAYQLQSKGSVALRVTVGGSTIDLDTVAPAGGLDFMYDDGVPSGFSVLGGESAFGD